jgi:hypothetical protein
MSYPAAPPPSMSPPPPAPQTVRTSGFAIASMVLGIMGWFYAVPAILAVVFGHIAYSQIQSSNGWKTGRGMAIAGLVLGYIWIALYVLIFIVALSNG